MEKKTYTIVIAEDDLDDQDFIKMALKDVSHKVEVNSVYNGMQLMDYLLKREAYKNIQILPDLVILDLNMPLVDGFDVLKQMREHNLLDKIPVYVLSTTRNQEHFMLATGLGARGFYTKPVNLQDLKKIVSEVCNICFEEKK
jgi:two-component system response regulator